MKRPVASGARLNFRAKRSAITPGRRELRKPNPMKVTNQKRIDGACDNMNVVIRENGNVYLSSMTLKDLDELRELGKTFMDLSVLLKSEPESVPA